MKLDNYKLKHTPSPKDKNRYKLSLGGTEKEVKKLVNKLGNVSSRPFPASEEKFEWSLFLYDTDKKFRKKLKKKLDKIVKSKKTKEKSRQKKDKKEEQNKKEDTSNIKPAEKKSKEKEPVSNLSSHTTLKENYVFDNFIVGTNTRFTYAACKAVAENPGENYNPLFIYGGVGLGKTHLMQSIGNYVKQNFPDYMIVYISTGKFIEEVINAIEKGTINELRNRYKDVDLLLIDDIQFLEKSESTQEEFFHIFNDMHDVKKQIVITSDKPPKKLTTLEERLKSRFEWGLTTDVKSPNFETRKAILKRKATKAGLELTEDISNYIAERLTSNIRELEGIINRIVAYKNISDENMNLDLVKDIISNILPGEPEEEEKSDTQQTPADDTPPPPGGEGSYSQQTPSSVQQPQPQPQAQPQYSAPQPSPQQSGKICSRCGSPQISFVPQYQRWYCGSCGMYVEPSVPNWQSSGQPGTGNFPPPPPQHQHQPQPQQQQPPPPNQQGGEKKCPTCSSNLEYISKYDRYYCRNCGKYTQPQSAQSSQNVPPPPQSEDKAQIKTQQDDTASEDTESGEEQEEAFRQKIIGTKKSDVREIKAGYILPEGSQQLFSEIVDKLHKLARQKKINFYIQPVFTHFYSPEVNINYDKLVHLAINNKVDIALSMEPGGNFAVADNFKSEITAKMEEKDMPLEVLPREPIKDSFALNIMLDIAICAKKNK
ncbi:MAG: chromosomal replication initiator protein DnaA [Elusimicrobiota bacterium]